MSWTPTKNTKCCATCAFWQGYRKDKKISFEVESPSVRAKCAAGVIADASQGPVASGGRSCSKYVKLG